MTVNCSEIRIRKVAVVNRSCVVDAMDNEGLKVKLNYGNWYLLIIESLILKQIRMAGL